MQHKNRLFTLILLASLITMNFSFIILNSKAITPFNPAPGSNSIPPATGSEYWDFDKGDKISYILKTDSNGMTSQKLLYFNISDIVYNNYTSYMAYYVVLRRMYFNTTLNSLVHIPLTNESKILASIINFTQMSMIPNNDYSSSLMYFNLFIPDNGTTGLHLWFAANALLTYYFNTFGGFFWSNPAYQIIQNPSKKTLFFYDQASLTQTYVKLSYYNNGTLNSGEVFLDYNLFFPGMYIKYNLTRNFDFNPLDDIKWAVDVGDFFYTGNGINETRYEIIKIINTSTYDEYWQFVYANISIWIPSVNQWIQIENNSIIGQANELLFTPYYIIPKGKTGKDICEMFKNTAMIYPELQFNYGNYWYTQKNTTSGEFVYTEYFPNGIMKYSYQTDQNSDVKHVFYYKNNSILNTGIHKFNISLIRVEFNFNISFSIDANSIVQIFFAGFGHNPTGVKLSYTDYFYFDIMVNDTSQISFPINITIHYGKSIPSGFKLWYYNTTLKKWIEISINDDGNGEITVQITHNSIFALTSQTPVQQPSEEEKKEEEEAGEKETPGQIPFGNLYLIFLLVATFSLIILTKKRIK
ncbi:MAG: hypothetical protein ACTSPW_19415 [Promethearchaeota archaeon]